VIKLEWPEKGLQMAKTGVIKSPFLAGDGKEATKEEMESDFFHQRLIGGIAPVQQQGTSAPKSFSTVQLLGGPLPVLSPQLRNELVLFTELWVINDDTEDYTTIQYIDPGIVIEGKLRRRNICGVKGHTPFTKICANETENYFWGASELMQVRPLQDMMNRRISEVDRISRLRARPPFSITGSSIADEKAVALQTPGGMFVDSAPQTKIDKYAPDNPTDMIAQINDIIGWFDDMAGFSASLQGKGESGVRSGVHAETMVRTGSPRLRDRSLLVERQCAAAGEFAFKLLQAKNAEQFGVDKVEEKGNMASWFKKKFSDEHQSMGFLLSQIPDDFRVTIDSHSSSAAFSEESKNLAFNLFKAGAIDAEDLIRLTNPSFADMLVDKLEAKKKAEQELIKQHPELLAKFGKKK
jgi:hypothetical protein